MGRLKTYPVVVGHADDPDGDHAEASDGEGQHVHVQDGAGEQYASHVAHHHLQQTISIPPPRNKHHTSQLP